MSKLLPLVAFLATPAVAGDVAVQLIELPPGYTEADRQLAESSRALWRGLAPDSTLNIFRSDGVGGFQSLLAEGDPAPGLPATSFGDLLDVVWSGGKMAVEAELEGDTTGESIWFGPPGGLELVMHENDDVPDPELPGIRFGSPTEVRLNRGHDVCFGTRLQGSGIDSSNDDSIWCWRVGDDPVLRVREGDPAPGRPVGEDLVGLEQDFPSHNIVVGPYSLDGTGDLFFTGRTSAGVGIWWFPDGSAGQLIAFEGTPAVGGADTWADLEDNRFTWGGTSAAFHGWVDVGTDRIILGGLPVNQRVVARSGDPVSGGGTLRNPVLRASNRFDTTVFSTVIDGVPTDSDFAVFAELGPGGSPISILREGDSAPAGEPSLTFSACAALAINEGHQVFLDCTIEGPTVSSASNETLWYWDPVVGLALVVREGRDLTFVNGQTRHVTSFHVDGPFLGLEGSQYDGLGAPYDERGAFVFLANFDDGTHGFVVSRLLPLTVVFESGFETGDLSEWSSGGG